ncbi:MAG: hypothetical protein EOQ83_26390 [Mesorhizobium sp.]|uniref:hypothetical protein n=1 Tax=Mesorhizobium sp. TaxID=1871066 RepID=UPI000FEA5151|nr:hypothetical protein [Mesorhizobium sp.]RWH58162.1 MAG: hypothetical protein EOQ83_26390 [Mesorhizobium sp.]
MADSDNTTTLPRVTRRQLLAGTAVAATGWEPKAFAQSDSQTELFADPAVVVWRKWQTAHQETERLCRKQQRLERKLTETIGFPCATMRLQGHGSVAVHSLQALHKVADFHSHDAATRADAEACLAAHQARWDAADREIGYSATLQAEREAADLAEGLLEVLSETPAASLAGVAAKLDAVIREGQPSKDDAEFPWLQIRSALKDLIRIGKRPQST